MHPPNSEENFPLVNELIDSLARITKSLHKTNNKNVHLKNLVFIVEDKISAFTPWHKSYAINQIRIKEHEVENEELKTLMVNLKMSYHWLKN